MSSTKSVTKITTFFLTNVHRNIVTSKQQDVEPSILNEIVKHAPYKGPLVEHKELATSSKHCLNEQTVNINHHLSSNQKPIVLDCKKTKPQPKSKVVKPQPKSKVVKPQPKSKVVRKPKLTKETKAKIYLQVQKILEDIGEECVQQQYNQLDLPRVDTVVQGISEASSSSYSDYSITSQSSTSGCSDTNKENICEQQQEDIMSKANAMLSSVGPTWVNALKDHFTKPYFVRLMDFVDRERSKHTVYPPCDQVFTWTMKCDVSNVKVVILGQDPYHNPHQAHGLCFSVQKGVQPPPSLQNIYKELSADLGKKEFIPPLHGDLSGWASQGVLLLNAVLTVRANEPNSHKDAGWEQFTDAVVAWINANLDHVVFMLWGAYAQKKGSRIDRRRHCVLTTTHPSPLSVYRGFFKCRHFSKANHYLLDNGKTPINWAYLP